jgi:hypothetical protein
MHGGAAAASGGLAIRSLASASCTAASISSSVIPGSVTAVRIWASGSSRSRMAAAMSSASWPVISVTMGRPSTSQG